MHWFYFIPKLWWVVHVNFQSHTKKKGGGQKKQKTNWNSGIHNFYYCNFNSIVQSMQIHCIALANENKAGNCFSLPRVLHLKMNNKLNEK
jgi:hypothetical protein